MPAAGRAIADNKYKILKFRQIKLAFITKHRSLYISSRISNFNSHGLLKFLYQLEPPDENVLYPEQSQTPRHGCIYEHSTILQ